MTEYYRLGGSHNRNLFSHCSGDWKSKSKVRRVGVGGGFSLGVAAFLLYAHVALSTVLKERKQALSCFLRGHKCYQVGAPLLGPHVTFFFGHAMQHAGS